LRDNDRRLRNGAEEFEFVISPDTTKFPGKKKRGRGCISSWCMVEFWNGGIKKAWNFVLIELRREDKYFHGRGVLTCLNCTADGIVRPSGLTICFSR
jgi:hypothetical protein